MLVAKALTRLKNAGKRVYVVPGNHDINNPHDLKRDNPCPQRDSR